MILSIKIKYLRELEFFLPFQKIMNCFEEQGPTLIGKSILPESFLHHYKNTKCQHTQNREIQTFIQNISSTDLIFKVTSFIKLFQLLSLSPKQL